MKNKKILLIFFIALILIISNVKFVYADSLSVEMKSNKQEYAANQTVRITVSIKNIESQNGIYGLSGKLDYGTNVFEKIQSDENGNTNSITALNGWGDLTFNSESNEFQLMKTSPAKTTQEIMQIDLKVKEGADLGTAVIMLNNLEATNGEDDITTSPTTISIAIKNASDIDNGTIIPPIVTTPSPSVVPSTVPSTITVSSPKVTTTPISGNLPQTGIGDSPTPILIGALVIVLGSFIAYRRYKDI